MPSYDNNVAGQYQDAQMKNAMRHNVDAIQDQVKHELEDIKNSMKH